MQGEHWIVNSARTLEHVIQEIQDAYGAHHYLRVQIKTGKDRTDSQNALSFAAYVDLYKSGKFTSANEARAYCKLHYGVPIRREEPEYNEVYARLIKSRFSYEEKLSLMIEPVDFPVTRDMNKDQFGRYMDAIYQNFAGVRFRGLDGENQGK